VEISNHKSQDVDPQSTPDTAGAELGGSSALAARLSGSTEPRLNKFGPWAALSLLVLMFITFSIASPHVFFTIANMRVIIVGQASILILALAIIVPLRGGDFDLSVSSVMILSGCVVGQLAAHGAPALVACVVGFLVGPLTGLVNGIIVVTFGIDSFIATLGSLTILSGLATLVSGGSLVSSFPLFLTEWAPRNVLGLPITVWIGWIFALVLWYAFELTPSGRYLLFIGGNRSSAYLAGLRVSAYRRGAFLVSGTLSAIAGLLFAGTLGSVDPSAGSAYLLPPLTAVFLGASAIKPGRYNIVGTLVALYLLAVGISGLELLGLQGWISDVFNGACLIGAVGFSMLFRRGRAV
jgi:ribose transport system permease protein